MYLPFLPPPTRPGNSCFANSGGRELFATDEIWIELSDNHSTRSRLNASCCALSALRSIAAARVTATAMQATIAATNHGKTPTSSAVVNIRLVRKYSVFAVAPKSAHSARTCSANAAPAWINDGWVSSNKGGTNLFDDTDERGVGLKCAVVCSCVECLVVFIINASLQC